MEDKKKGWKGIRKIKLDHKRIAKRIRKAEVTTTRHAHKFVFGRINNIRAASREITLWLAFVGLLVCALGVQILWNQGGYMVMAPRSGGVYVEGVLGKVNTVNPLFYMTDAEASVSRLVFSSLYNYDKTGVLQQDIATNMEVDKTQKIYTITLRDDVVWHDGEKMTADDIVYTINLIKNPSTRSVFYSNWLDIAVSAPNPTTVVFTLPAVYAAFPQALTFPIVPQHILKDVAPAAVRESAFSNHPVGSGPFKFSRLQQTDATGDYNVVHLVSNRTYYKGTPKLSRFELRAYPDEMSLVKAVNVGEVSGAADVSVTEAKNITVPVSRVPERINSGVYLILNMQSDTLKDKALRQALHLGTDMDAIIKSLGGGVRGLNGPLLKEQAVAARAAAPAAFDSAQAEKKLQDAGWVKQKDGFRQKGKTPLVITITTTKNSEYETVLRFIKSQWEKIGIKVVENVIDTSSATSTFIQDTLQGRNYDVLLYELAIGADPDVYAYWHSSQIGSSGYNFSNYSNKIVDASLAGARSSIDARLRNVKYELFVQQWLQDIPAIGLYQAANEYVTVKGAHAVDPDSTLITESDRYANILYWSVASKDVRKTP